MIKAFIKKIIYNSLNIFLITALMRVFKRKCIVDKNSIDHGVLLEAKPDIGSSCVKKLNAIPTNQIDLSIIVPCFNSEKYIMACFNSLANQQTSYNVEFIFVDDGSMDNTGSILDGIASTNKNVKVVHQMNQGPSVARNEGIKIASGKYLTFVDSDDYIENQFLVDNLLNFVYSLHPENRRIIVEYNLINRGANKKYKKRMLKSKKCNPTDLKGYACGKIYSSEFFTAVCFPPHYLYEDTINSLILFHQADELYKTDETGYVYVIHEGGQTKMYNGNNNAIDTFYITKTLLNDAFELGLIESNHQYINSFLRQVVCNFMRTNNLDDEIKKIIFYETCFLLKNYPFCLDYVKLKYFHLCKSLAQFDYNYYKLACSLIG